jgi:hypothetical protein
MFGGIVDRSGWRVATPTRVGTCARVPGGGCGNYDSVPTREVRPRPRRSGARGRGGVEDGDRRRALPLDADAVEQEVAPEELFAKLRPFKQLVADDIESGDDTA